MKKRTTTTTNALDWLTMLGLVERLKHDGLLMEYLLILMGSHFGLRIGDLLKITWQDALGQEEIFLKETKTKKNRSIKINSRVKNGLEYVAKSNKFVLENRQDTPILANRWGNSFSISYINKRLKYICIIYHVKNVQNPSSHLLRKTFGRRVYEQAGENENALIFLSQIFGHSSTAITRSYLGISQKQISDAYLNL